LDDEEAEEEEEEADADYVILRLRREGQEEKFRIDQVGSPPWLLLLFFPCLLAPTR
jgi:hypothetical protein